MSQSSNLKGVVFFSKGIRVDPLMQPFRKEDVKWIKLDDLSKKSLPEREDDAPTVFVLEGKFLPDDKKVLRRKLSALADDRSVIIVVLRRVDRDLEEKIPEDLVFSFLYRPLSIHGFSKAIRNAFNHINLNLENKSIQGELERRSRELGELNSIGIALSAENDTDKLLDLILQKSREITASDSGTLYLVEDDPENEDTKRLRFKHTQNDSQDSGNIDEFTIPLTKTSMAGYTALTGKSVNVPDAYYISEDEEFSWGGRSFDEQSGYRSKSMLVVPMKDHNDEIIGVIQLLNRKKDFDVRLESHEVVEQQVISFDNKDEDLVSSLASQAAVALENNLLLEDIENLFEGFVRASVTAVEARDPTTSGHSSRVAILTVGLAEKVDRVNEGKYKNTKFTSDQIKEIRYASLLHDFGKIGVRENVLVKPKKLPDEQVRLILSRFDFVKKAVEVDYSHRKIEHLVEKGIEDYQKIFNRIDEDFAKELQEIDEYLRTILEANEPTVLEGENFDSLVGIAARTYADVYGEERDLLTSDEFKFLSIKRGSLDEQERLEIQSHVAHTFQFLERIPWTQELKDIPNIAHAHHEHLNGDGYPRHLTGSAISTQSRIMTISDIYDALTASDRPYKKAVPTDRALDILNFEVKDDHVDPDLLEVFIESKVYQLTMNKG